MPRSSKEVTGFKAIDGDGQGRYVAVGFYGELWLYESSRWRRIDSPTRVKLEAVRWVGETVYIAGGGGKAACLRSTDWGCGCRSAAIFLR